MKKNEKEPVERQVYAMFDLQITWLRNHWRNELSKYQKLIDELLLIGLQPTAETIDDLISSNGKNTSLALIERSYAEAKKTGISDPAIIQNLVGSPVARLEPALVIARSIQATFSSSMLGSEMKTAIHWRNVTIENGKVSISDEKIQELINSHFAVYIETAGQKKIFELTEICLPALSEIFQEARKFNVLVQFNDLFEYDHEKRQYRMKTSVMHFFGQVN